MAFNDEMTLEAGREIWIRVKKDDGTIVVSDCMGKTRPARETDYAVVKPGEVVTELATVSCLNLPSGRYVLIARYRDGSEKPPPPPNGIARLAAELQSAVVSLEILPKGAL